MASQEQYDALATIMFDPELSDDERQEQQHDFRRSFIAENSFRQYGELLLVVSRDHSDLRQMDKELGKIQYGE